MTPFTFTICTEYDPVYECEGQTYSWNYVSTALAKNAPRGKE